MEEEEGGNNGNVGLFNCRSFLVEKYEGPDFITVSRGFWRANIIVSSKRKKKVSYSMLFCSAKSKLGERVQGKWRCSVSKTVGLLLFFFFF